MQQYYKVTTKFFDTGHVTATISCENLNMCPKENVRSTSTCDIYEDYFDNLHDAINWKKQAYQA